MFIFYVYIAFFNRHCRQRVVICLKRCSKFQNSVQKSNSYSTELDECLPLEECFSFLGKLLDSPISANKTAA